MIGSNLRPPAPYCGRYPQLKRAQRGLATVEAAIVLAVFLLLILIILDGGRMIYAYGVMSHAARDGVRFAVVRGSEAAKDQPRRTGDAPTDINQIITYVQNRAAPLTPVNVIPTLPANMQRGTFVEVQVEYDFDPVTPFIPIGSITLTSTSQGIIHF